ncbi:MAG: hypothetical protein JWM57_117, partial [Phycisphaerales bacterium]|nr:hypothetical protein [Phycisphaerales bacterium]
MNKMNPSVDGFLRKQKAWQEELKALRGIILDSELIEEVKWRVPCYTFNKKNVLFIGAFKDAAVLSFVKGVLLKDAKKLLIQQTENSQSVRIIRFTSVEEIGKLEKVLKAYINEAVAVEKAGLKVKMKSTAEFAMPDEFQARLDESTPLEESFTALTPGRQRAYLLHFAGAKQSKTRAARVDKWV